MKRIILNTPNSINELNEAIANDGMAHATFGASGVLNQYKLRKFAAMHPEYDVKVLKTVAVISMK